MPVRLAYLEIPKDRLASTDLQNPLRFAESPVTLYDITVS